MHVSFFDDVHDNRPKTVDATFDEYAELLRYASELPFARDTKTAAMCSVPALFDPPQRGSINVVQRYAFTGDVDGDKPGDPGFDGMVALLARVGFRFVVHTTTNSSLTTNRYRVIIPFTKPVDGPTYEALCTSINQMLGSIFDESTFDVGRLSIVAHRWRGASDKLPNESDGHHGFAAVLEGDDLDPEIIMSAYPPVIREKPDDAATTAFLAEYVASVEDHDIFALMDFDRSPLVRPEFIDAYLMSPSGGRFYSFMVKVAGRALAKGLPCTPEIVLALGLEMSRRGGKSHRPYARHEAQNAVRFAAQRHVASGNSINPDEQKEQRLAAIMRRLSKTA
ncbi:hypothetical protein ACFODL_15400 [Phenylobacterium terrae]|uniref:Uncharacterized protein n=1 Tax=Phenylobacterium terrae TaxID=2665495 RepID=A0ABW4N7C4_9CAUL